MSDSRAWSGPPAGLSEEEHALLDRAREAARGELRAAAEAGPPGRLNRPLVRALGDSGLLPRIFPERHGGAAEGEARAIDLCVLREGLALECTEAETALALQGLGAYPILQSGTDAQREQWIPEVAAGRAVAAFALSEPDAGSDPAALTLQARRDGEGAGACWILDGEKTWISNAPDADVYTVFARTTERAGARGVSAFCVPGDSGGLSGEPIDMLAPHAIGTLRFDGVRIPADSLLGERDRGFKVAMKTLDLFRPSVGAFAVGMAQAALDCAVAHATEREQGGRKLMEHQAVGHALAAASTEVEAARLLVRQAARAQDAGVARNTKLAAMAKLLATEVAQRAVDASVQALGARALVRGHLLEHLQREVRAPRIYEGTSEIQREIIARELAREAGER